MSSPAPTPNPTTQLPSEPDPLFTQRTAIILLGGAFIGLVVGALTFLGGGSAAGAVLAGLAGAGASVMGLHKLIG
ncbi:hypothetical protein AB0I39_28020 [Kitasatospora purpeofusca]|uniref:hypothetical protein n=1 Tax=Kitasatospora purpeofusca TaxID=67352 RepID=UPI0033EFD901